MVAGAGAALEKTCQSSWGKSGDWLEGWTLPKHMKIWAPGRAHAGSLYKERKKSVFFLPTLRITGGDSWCFAGTLVSVFLGMAGFCLRCGKEMGLEVGNPQSSQIVQHLNKDLFPFSATSASRNCQLVVTDSWISFLFSTGTDRSNHDSYMELELRGAPSSLRFVETARLLVFTIKCEAISTQSYHWADKK